MKLTKEESQALAFIGGMILISAAARFAGRPGPVVIEGSQVSIAELQSSSMALMNRADAAKAGASLGWVNVNDATEAEISAIPEVGPAAAAAIVAERTRLGALELDDVRALPGLKASSLEAIAENASFGTWDDPTRMTPPPGIGALQQPARKRTGQGTSGQSPRSTAGTVVPGRRAGSSSGSTAPPVVVRRAPEGKVDGPAAQRIAVNEATSEELQRLPGVGPALAARIIAYRQEKGRFRKLEDLDAVSGIGPALLEKIGPLVRF